MINMQLLVIILVYGGLLLSILASILIRLLFSIYSKKPNSTGITAAQAVEIIANNEDFPIKIQEVPGKLNDYFDPRTNIVALSYNSIDNASIASVAVAAHEMGHVAQKFNNNLLFRIRSSIVKGVNITTQLGYILFVLGIAIDIFNLAYLGLILFSFSFIFMLVTFPIEIDASLKGLKFIKKYKLLADNEIKGAILVLLAAALTYFAALIQNIGQILRMLSILSSKKE